MTSSQSTQPDLRTDPRYAWFRMFGPAAGIALESLGAKRTLELGLDEMLGEYAEDFLERAPTSRGGSSDGHPYERAYAVLVEHLNRMPDARASIAKIRRFDAAGDVEAIFIELAYWLGVGEGFKMPGRRGRDV